MTFLTTIVTNRNFLVERSLTILWHLSLLCPVFVVWEICQFFQTCLIVSNYKFQVLVFTLRAKRTKASGIVLAELTLTRHLLVSLFKEMLLKKPTLWSL